MKSKGKFRLICTMEGTWKIDHLISRETPNGEIEGYWSTIKVFKEKHQAGYEAATKWMEENL